MNRVIHIFTEKIQTFQVTYFSSELEALQIATQKTLLIDPRTA